MRIKIWRREPCVAGASPWVSGPLSTSPQRIWVITTPSVAFRSGGSWVVPWRVRWAGPVWHSPTSDLSAAEELPPSGGGVQSLAMWSSVSRQISDQKVVVLFRFWSSTLSFTSPREQLLPAGSTEQMHGRKKEKGNRSQHFACFCLHHREVKAGCWTRTGSQPQTHKMSTLRVAIFASKCLWLGTTTRSSWSLYLPMQDQIIPKRLQRLMLLGTDFFPSWKFLISDKIDILTFVWRM